jgi:signal transduction histidine kinase
MKLSRSFVLILGSWAFFVGGYAAAALLLPPGHTLAMLSVLFACVAPLFANTCLLWNAASPYRRRNTFWMLLALGCALWLAGHLIWAYEANAVGHDVPSSLASNLLFLLHAVPLMGALALMPHARKMRETLRYGLLDMLLLALLWVYTYVFAAVPWRTFWLNEAVFRARDIQICLAANLIVVIGFGILFFRARGAWRAVYGHLCGATALFSGGSLWANGWVSAGKTYPGSIHALPIVASFVWFGTAGIVARKLSPEPEPAESPIRRDTQRLAQLAMLIVLLGPVVAGWNVFASHAPVPVKQFRLVVTLVALFVGTALVFLRQHLVYEERTELVHELWESLENVKRLRTHFVQSEKLASLGQLAAGAAHEINNPLTAILGYADMLIQEHPQNTRPRTLGEKIRDQSRRTRDLVTNLLSFARQVPSLKQLLDLNTVLAGAVQLRNLDLRDRNIRIEFESRSMLPAVQGDPNQLLQVFYHLISNSVDAMETVGGGVLLIRTLWESGNVVIEFSDTGPGMQEPEKVFDPFYTTKPVGKGTGLGLSVCYGIVHEHGGRITGFNRTEGGCTFRLELPAVLALFPQAPAFPTAPVSSR